MYSDCMYSTCNATCHALSLAESLSSHSYRLLIAREKKTCKRQWKIGYHLHAHDQSVHFNNGNLWIGVVYIWALVALKQWFPTFFQVFASWAKDLYPWFNNMINYELPNEKDVATFLNGGSRVLAVLKVAIHICYVWKFRNSNRFKIKFRYT